MTKAKIYTDIYGTVFLEYTDLLSDRRLTRVFSCPEEGGYVREVYSDGQTKQVCERLSNMGVTISAESRESLINLIRAEYRAMRRSEKRAFEA